jgi:uncharacterized membrane protein YkvA (DUF1232 family)
MSDPANPTPNLETLLRDLLAWHERWRHTFVAGHPIADYLLKSDYHDLVSNLPDLVQFIVRLLQDPQLDPALQAHFITAGEYLLNTNDLISEDQVGASGFLDDAVVLLEPLKRLAEEHLELVQKHWSSDHDLLQLIQTYYPQREAIMAYALKIKEMGH